MPPRPVDERTPNAALRRHRLLHGWSQQDVADELIRLGHDLGERTLGVSAKMIGSWERGESKPRPPYPKLLVRLFGVSASDLGLFRLEAWHPEREKGDDVDRRTFLETMLGAAVLTSQRGAIAGLPLDAFLHEPRRYLFSWSITPTRELLATARTCLWLAEGSESDEAVCEASLLLSWLAYDLGDTSRMRRHYQSAVNAAVSSGNRPLLAYVLTSWADAEDGPTASRLMKHAWEALPDNAPSILRNYLLSQEAITHARLGDAPRALTVLERHTGPSDPAPVMVFPTDEASVSRTRGFVAVHLGDPDHAIPSLERVLDAWGEPTKRRAYVLAELSRAYRQAGDQERARETLDEAQTLGRRLGLERVGIA